jgi:hypothetical protein
MPGNTMMRQCSRVMNICGTNPTTSRIETVRPGCLKIAVLCVTAATAYGCSSKKGAEGTEWLVVTTDAAGIEAHRQRAEENSRAEFDALIEGLGGEYWWAGPDTVQLIESRKDEALTRLNALLTPGAPTAKGTAAALFLCRMGIESVRPYLVRVLAEGDATLRVRVLNEIGESLLGYSEENQRRYREFVQAAPDLVAGLVKHLDDRDVKIVKAAIQCCGSLQLPGANERFRALLARPDAPDRQRILFWLSKGPLTSDLLDVALATPASVDPNNPPDTSLLAAFARQDDVQLRQRARQELVRILDLWKDDGRLGFRGDRISLIEVLAETSGPEDLEWLRRAAAQEHGYYGQPLLARLITLEGDAGRERLETLLTDRARRSDMVQVAGRVYAGTGDSRIVAAIAAAAAGADPETTLTIATVLLDIGGDEARSQAAALVPRLEPTQGEHIQRRLNSPAIEELDAAVAGSGVMSPAALQRARAEFRSRPGGDSGWPPGLFEYMTAGGCAMIIDAETGELPCRHDRLLQEFAAASDGSLRPEAVHQEWHQENEEDFEAEYTLRFVHQSALYSGRLRNYGDWYDVERTVEIINRALSDAGLAQRFVGIGTGDQTAAFVFADPARLGPLAEQFHLPLSDNLAASMQAGKEFEERVREQLELEEQ